MKVLLINGSPREKECTYTALSIMADELKAQGVEAEIAWIGNKAMRGCIACGKCSDGNGCVFKDDFLAEIAPKIKEADAYVFASPVYYASANGSMISFMDRLFRSEKDSMQFKPACVVASARRAGTTTTIDQLNKYLTINNMLVVPAPYWNMVHGSCASDVYKDEEGVSIMRSLASSMVWLLKLLENGKSNNLSRPQSIERKWTNFIR